MTAVVFLALCHERQGNTEERLPEWNDSFWDDCRNVIRIGRGQMVRLDEPDSKLTFCVMF